MWESTQLKVLLVEPEPVTAERLEAVVAIATSRASVVRACGASEAVRTCADADVVLVGPRALDGLAREDAARLRRALPAAAILACGDDVAARRISADDSLLEEEWTPRLVGRALRQAVERRHFARELHHLIEERLAGEASMRNIVSSWADGVVVVNEDRRILYVNPAAESLLARSFERLLGTELPVPIDGDAAECELAGASGVRIVSLRTVPIAWEGRPALLVTLRDETDSRAAERALRESEARLMRAQKMEAIGRLAGGVAHDFNNLLTAISGYSELILGELPSGGTARPDLMEICKAAERATTLTRQLLAFSRRQVLQPVVLDLNQTVGDLQKLLRRVLGEDIALRCALAPGAARVKADPGSVEQVILDLAVNAREAMPKGGELLLETGVVALDRPEDRGDFVIAPGSYARLVLSDTGCGMDAETLSHVFEPFFTTKGEGTGLGLSTVYGTVKQSGGYVWATSEPGSGTCFEIYLPASRESAVAAGTPERASSSRRETILLAEDERPVRELARRMLEREGYRVLTASDGNEAVRVSVEHSGPIDLFVTDVVMPVMGGVDAADEVLSQRPGLKLLFLSGYSDRIVAREGKLESGFEYLAKPFSGAELVAKVRSVLEPRSVTSS